MLAFTISVFGLTLWLGLYLLRRDPRLRLVGLALVAYALGWASTILRSAAPASPAVLAMAHFSWPLFLLPAPLWAGALLSLLPQQDPYRLPLARIWRYGLIPLAMLCYLLNFPTTIFFAVDSNTPAPGLGLVLLSLVVLLPFLASFALFWRALPAMQPQKTLLLLPGSLLLFFLGTALVLLAPRWLPQQWPLLMIGLGLSLSGLAMVARVATSHSEAWLPDFLRSLDFSTTAVLLFGGQVILVILLGTGLSLSLLVLLLTIITTATVVQVFSEQIEALADRGALASFPQLRKTRADLRATADALPRINQALDLEALDEVEFSRLTRRALSHFGDLARLAGSPLTYIPLVEARLKKRGAADDALERAVELKALLLEGIIRLKPAGKGDFGTSDQWRYYNALYYPYIVGLKPYSHRRQRSINDPIAKEALEWFRVQVPERTLHNWQTAAATLIAQDLKKPHKSEAGSAQH